VATGGGGLQTLEIDLWAGGSHRHPAPLITSTASQQTKLNISFIEEADVRVKADVDKFYHFRVNVQLLSQ
jgi:hypothetical protein